MEGRVFFPAIVVPVKSQQKKVGFSTRMLKALELFGFKSFADKTRFEFPDGITVVVGPNGSGKSNVVDGIRWVLGEQSAKSLRGSEMADVIFKGSGTGSRKPANTAEVTIVFDNAQRLIDREDEEIRVTRRVYRSGEGEYLINGEPCRLRDVKELFRGTGVGADAYSLIEQGKVDSLLQASPRDRRAIFEEAAGISRFKAKKVESQRRLDRVQQNLLRLSDIVEEVERRLKNLRSQATKAQRYQEYTGRLQELRTIVARVDWQQMTVQLETLDSQFSELQSDDGRLRSTIDHADFELRQVDQQIASHQTRLHELESSVSNRRESIARLESDSHNCRRMLEELAREEQRFVRRLSALRSRAGDVQLQLRQVETELVEAQRQYDAAKQQADTDQQQLDELTSQARATDNEMQISRQQHAQQLRGVAEFNTRLSGLRSESAVALKAIERTSSQVEDGQQRLVAAEQDLASLLERELALQHDLAAADAELQGAEQDLLAVQQQLATVQEELSARQRAHSGLSERIKVLDEIEQRSEGIGSGVKDLMAQAVLDPTGALGEIRGIVADLLEVHVEMAPLVDAALGPASQYVVVDGERLIQEIEQGNVRTSGRVGLLSLPLLERTAKTVSALRPGERFSPTPRSQPTAPASALRPSTPATGLLGAAAGFVSTQPRYQVLVQYLLENTWFVETLAAAFDLHRSAPARYVTRAGEVISPDGLLFLGPRGSATGIVSRRSQLRALRGQLQELESAMRQVESQATELTERKSRAEQRCQQATKTQKQCAAEFAEHRAQTHTVSERVTHLRQLRDTVSSELREHQQRQAALLSEQAAAQVGLRELEEAIGLLDAVLREAQGKLSTLHEQRRAIEDRTTSSKVALAKSEQRVESLRAQALRAQQDNEERSRAVEEARREADRCATRRTENERAILQATSELAELYLQREAIDQELSGFSAKQRDFTTRRRELAKVSQQAQSKRRELAESRHRVELEAGQLRLQRETISARLLEDYGIDISAMDPLAWSDATAPAGGNKEPAADASNVTPVATEAVEFSPEQPTAAPQQQRETIEQEITQLRRKISNIGAVNLESLDELQELESRFGHLSQQYHDLVAAKEALEKIIHKINADSRRMFSETLEVIRENFKLLFRRAFGGGHADIVVEEDVDILECGIDIVATPPGKHSVNISLLSGGERALTAVTLLLAIFRVRPSPFCVLDEVDGPLDEANIGRFVAVLREFLERTKVVIVTHSKKTMSAATTLYGVTMQESGVSKRVSVCFEDVSDDGHISDEAVRREAKNESTSDDEQAA